MKIRALDADGDWTFGNNLSNYLLGQDAIEQDIATKLKEWKNDCFFNVDAGIMWEERYGKKGQESLLELDIRKIILSCEGVVELILVNIQNIDRTLKIEYVFSTIYSTNNQTTFIL